jgi:transcriptional regulator with GAF, ATPase, and Fis domain
MQAKLLRVLQEREFERVGDTRSCKVDVRVIASTNRDLQREIEAGCFRQDLFYRLSVFPITVPPLRERQSDILPLAEHFARRSAERLNYPVPQFDKIVCEQLLEYHWPGNVRELHNVIERAVILSEGGTLRVQLPLRKRAVAQASSGPFVRSVTLLTRQELKAHERDNILAALMQTRGKVFGPSGAAVLLGMKPTTLATQIKTLGLNHMNSSHA